jgi:heavy metal sensor kinase
MVSFRTHISRIALIVILVLLTAFALLVYTGLTNLLYRHVDEELHALARQESQRVEFKTGALSATEDNDEHEMREAARITVILSPSGTLVWKGAAVVPRPPLDAAQLTVVGQGRVVYDTIAESNTDLIRRVSYPVTDGGTVQYILQTETSLRLVQDALQLLMLLLAGLTAAIAGVAWGGSRWLAHQALMPVEVLTATAEKISVPSLKTRMDLDAPYEEFSRLTRVFNAMLDRLHHVFEGQRRFVADAAHEMQTPLTVMKGTLEVALQKSRTVDEYREALVTNLGQVERLSTLTRSLLTLAQFSGDRPPINLAPLALEPLVQGLVKELTVLAEDRKVQLILDMRPVPRVLGDEGRVTQLLVNLLDNALAHTSEGGTVHVRLSSVNDQVMIEVEDTGTGIAPEHLPHVFERFYRGDPSRQRESGGAGLGLAIVKELAEAHEGTVSVESALGKGTRFTVTLPSYKSPGAD